MKLIPSKGGCFELSADGELIYSKLEAGKFPDEKAMIDAVGGRLKTLTVGAATVRERSFPRSLTVAAPTRSADLLDSEGRPMLFFGRKKRLTDYASCAG